MTKLLRKEEAMLCAGVLLGVALVDHVIRHQDLKRDLRFWHDAYHDAVEHYDTLSRDYDALAEIKDDLLR